MPGSSATPPQTTADVAPSPQSLADDALRLVGVDAALADERAAAAVAAARAAGDVAAESMAWRARGLAAREQEQLDTAETHLRKAVLVARDAGTQTAAQARMSLALVLLERGELVQARRMATRAVSQLTGQEQARARVNLALIQQRAGALEDALATYALALRQLRRHKDELWEARLLNNRGILQAYRGQSAAAELDLERCELLLVGLGQELLAADAHWNLGFVAGVRGDPVTALRRFAEAEPRLTRAGVARGAHALDQCQVLLSLGLVDEALDVIRAGITELRSGQGATDLAEAQLLLAETLLAAGFHKEARDAADQAVREFQRQKRSSLTLLARYALLRASSGSTEDGEWDRAPRIADELRLAGWSVAATEVTLLTAQRAIRAGRSLSAAMLADALAAARTGPAGQRLRAWHTVALARLSRGDAAGAQSALRAGLRVHDLDRLSLSATELQVHTAARAKALASTGVGIAVAAGSADRVFAWAERWRAGSMQLRSGALETSDAALLERLAELRAVTAEIEQGRLLDEDPLALMRRQRALERSVAQLARLEHRQQQQSPAATIAEVKAANPDGTLIEYVQHDQRFYAVVVAAGRQTLHELGDAGIVAAELEALRFSLGRQARGASERIAAAAATSVAAALDRLDQALVAPLAPRLAAGLTVVVPTGSMHVLPWGVLPTLAGRPVTVAPSASVWLTATRAEPRSDGRAVVVGGPDLPGVEVEVAAVSEVYGAGVVVLRPAEATVGRVTAALDGASLAHLAAHGRFRSDNPQFSCLQMADGALTVYDLEALRQAPDTVVLSACDAGLSAVHPGDELMGLASALLRLGSRTLVASVAPVPDEVAQQTMVHFHRSLYEGIAPAEALVRARHALPPAAQPAAGAFVCFGAG